MTDHLVAVVIVATIVGALALWGTADWARAIAVEVQSLSEPQGSLAQQFALVDAASPPHPDCRRSVDNPPMTATFGWIKPMSWTSATPVCDPEITRQRATGEGCGR